MHLIACSARLGADTLSVCLSVFIAAVQRSCDPQRGGARQEFSCLVVFAYSAGPLQAASPTPLLCAKMVAVMVNPLGEVQILHREKGTRYPRVAPSGDAMDSGSLVSKETPAAVPHDSHNCSVTFQQIRSD